MQTKYIRWSLIIVTAITMILFDRPLVRGDGIAYMAWSDTLILDQDVNLNNQHDRFRTVNTYQIEWSFERERWVNIFPFGVAFVQAPFYVVGHVFHNLGLLDLNPEYFQQMQGLGLPYSFWTMIGANILMLIAVLLAWEVGRRYSDPLTAAIVVYLVFLGTPIFYYTTISPLNSHNAGAFTTACFMYLLLRCVEQDTTRPRLYWIGLGVFAGLTVMTRWQLLLVVVPGWFLILYERQWRGLFISTTAAAITLLPLPLIWNEMFGSPLLVPFDSVNDEPFMQRSNYALNVLWHTLIHSPVILLSLAGLAFVPRKWAVTLGSIILLQLLVNGAALDWNAGQSYGMRRMSELYFIYAWLACVFVGWLLKRNIQRIVPIVRVSLVVFAGYTLLYIFAYMSFTWTNPNGMFSDTPDVMIGYFLNQHDNLWILWEVYRTHAGPLAWTMPGP